MAFRGKRIVTFRTDLCGKSSSSLEASDSATCATRATTRAHDCTAGLHSAWLRWYALRCSSCGHGDEETNCVGGVGGWSAQTMRALLSRTPATVL